MTLQDFKTIAFLSFLCCQHICKTLRNCSGNEAHISYCISSNSTNLLLLPQRWTSRFSHAYIAFLLWNALFGLEKSGGYHAEAGLLIPQGCARTPELIAADFHPVLPALSVLCSWHKRHTVSLLPFPWNVIYSVRCVPCSWPRVLGRALRDGSAFL